MVVVAQSCEYTGNHCLRESGEGREGGRKEKRKEEERDLYKLERQQKLRGNHLFGLHFYMSGPLQIWYLNFIFPIMRDLNLCLLDSYT